MEMSASKFQQPSNNVPYTSDQPSSSSVRYNKGPVEELYKYFQNNGIHLSALKFEYEPLPKGKVNCVLKINNKDVPLYNGEYKINDGKFNSKREAKNAVAEFILKELMGALVPDFRNPILKLKEYCRDNIDGFIEYMYGINRDGTFTCGIKINDKFYDGNVACKSKKKAKEEISEYVYNVLTKGPAVAKLQKHLKDGKTPYKLEDLDFVCEKDDEKNVFNCMIKLGKAVFNQDLWCKSEKEAENAIAEYVYNVLVEESNNGETSSSEVNH